MCEVSIRPAELGDIPNLVRLRLSGASDPERLTSAMSGYLTDDYSPSHALRDRAVFVATCPAGFCGYISGHRTNRFGLEGEVQWLNVDEEFRGKGVAALLLDQLFEWFEGQDIHRICVNVAPDNDVARRVYARYGAREFGEHWMIWDSE